MEAVSNENFLLRIINYFRTKSNVTDIDLVVPDDIFYRTELMCECISDELDVEFELSHFLTALYDNFIYEAITKYDTEKINKMLQSVKKYNNRTVMIINGKKEAYTKFTGNIRTILIEMQNDDIKKGELVLLELKSLYNCDATFPELMSSIWIDYIEQYRQGKKTAYSHLLKIIKE